MAEDPLTRAPADGNSALNELPLGGSPLTPEQMQTVQRLVSTLTPLQQAWVSGYMAATANTAGPIALQAPPSLAEVVPFTILYGTETNNAKGVAEELAAKAQALGLDTKLVNMADYKPTQLKHERFLGIVVATHGEGDPPEGAEKLHAFLSSKKAPKLDNTHLAVIGLGDSSYEFFCQTAIDFEERLTNLGATVLFERALLDIDYDDHAPAWVEGAAKAFEPLVKAANEGTGAGHQPVQPVAAEPISLYTKKNPYEAEVAAVQKITGRDSIKDVRHVEILLEDENFKYQVGDALAVHFFNDDTAVDSILTALTLDPEASVEVGNKPTTLRAALIEDLELTLSYPGFVEKYAAITGNQTLLEMVEDKVVLRSYIADRQIYDVILDHPEPIAPQALINCLRKIQPRSYSIASSQTEFEEEVHLTVATVEFNAFDRDHLGGCSGYLNRRVEEGTRLRIYVEPNDNFRLPYNPDTPIIMIGPGTGIAPFRAFLQEREAVGAEGHNWLFFGNPHFTQDFLYQVELQKYLASGLLTKLNVAFSRDQANKIYVQDRIREEGATLYEWLSLGAHLYVCGDANHMAKDVHAALLEVVQTHGGLDAEAAVEYLEELRDQKRYQKDVY
ncbi:MAG: assimilatory sulfite reductase (NADPH) flavoprotein subunit [Pseudomonadota bacterium]